jgi:hypothetical protein
VVSNAKARNGGGRDEDSRMRSTCKATDHCHGGYGNRGEFTEKTLNLEGNEVREFYAALEGAVVVGIEATGAMQWFLELLEELGIGCRVGHPAKIRAAETRPSRHLQYRLIANLRAMAILAIFRPRRIARWKYLLRHSGMLRTVTCAASTSKKRNSELPCLVICPNRRRSPLDSSSGTSPR